MSTFRLEIVTPEGCSFDGEAEALLMDTGEGRVSIRAQHADYIAALRIGEIVLTAGGRERRAACGGGFVSVTDGEVHLVTTTFEYADDIDADRAETARIRAERLIAEAQSDKELAQAEAKLARALNRLRVAGK